MYFSVNMIASNEDVNCNRFYCVEVNQGLPGYFVVTVRYGRLGTRGRVRRSPAPSLDQARILVQTSLKKRRSAQHRIQAAYRVTALYDPQGWSQGLLASP